jgi:hypothetical protein
MPAPANALPPINVVLQNAPGMSEWAKTLLSASVGFVFAMVASVVMEYLKPWIARRSLQRDISAHLREEVMLNLNLLIGAMNTIDHVNRGTPGFVEGDIANAGLVLVDHANSDRFDMYFSEHMPLIYEQAGSRELMRFYRLIKAIRSTVKRHRWIMLRVSIREAIEMGTKYLGDRGLAVVREETFIDRFFGLDLDGNKVNLP